MEQIATMIDAQIRALESDLAAAGVPAGAPTSHDVAPVGVVTSCARPVVPVHWIACRTLAEKGFPLEGPAISFQKEHALFNASPVIVNELCPIGSITIQDDEEWFHFPGIGVAYQKATGIENYFAVAFSQRLNKWGAGFGNGIKGRKAAAYLALAVALAKGTCQYVRLEALFPGFASLCISTGSCESSDNAARGFAEKDDTATGRRRRLAEYVESQTRSIPCTVSTAKGEIANAPAPQVHWIGIKKTSKLVKQGWPAVLPAIFHDKSQQPFFSIASTVLDDVLVKKWPNLYHESDWERFPEIRESLKAAFGPKVSEYSFCVATCNDLYQLQLNWLWPSRWHLHQAGWRSL